MRLPLGVNRSISPDALFERYQAIGGDAVVNLGALRVKSEELRNTRKKLMKDFTDLLIGEFAISLAGKDMLIETSSRLRREISRESWERDRNSGAQRYEKFLANLEKEKALVLPLSEEEIAKLHKDLKVAWDGVWCPMPDDCAKTLFNPGFSEEEKRSTVEKMDGLSESNPGRQLETLRRELEQNKADQDIVDRKILAVRGDNEKEAKDLVDEIKRKSDQIASLERNIGDCERQQKAAEHDLEHARQERGRAFADRKSKDPYLYQSMRAGQAAAMTKKIINKSYSHYVDDIASEMTSAYISMANKDIVSKIEIGNDCDIKLLTSQGNDLREMVLSHGESEIFALALIAAIARVSRTCFPFIIDTPLANLDEQHRRAFLHYFSADMKNQVLFLSTDEEIRGRNMKILRNRVARKFLIEQERLGNIWRNVVRPDCYFEED